MGGGHGGSAERNIRFAAAAQILLTQLFFKKSKKKVKFPGPENRWSEKGKKHENRVKKVFFGVLGCHQYPWKKK